jgi:hypothetical protein
MKDMMELLKALIDLITAVTLLVFAIRGNEKRLKKKKGTKRRGPRRR